MGIAVPQLAPASEDRVSGAQVIDGSLKFNGSSKNRLDRTVSSVGNQKTWTWSGWIKRNKLADEQVVFTAGASTGGTYWAALRLNTDDSLQFINNSSNSTDININTTQRFRDVSSWYHILLRVDITNTTTNDRIDLYINGVKVDDFSTQTQPGTGVNTGINYNHIHAIGGEPARNLYYDTLQMSQVYLIDGQALGPENFGYTDPLTNTWRPKKYTGEFNFTVGTTNYTSISTLAALSGSTLNSSYNDVSKVFDGSGTGVRTVEETSNQGEKLSITFSPAITLSSQTVSIDTYSTYQGMFVTVGGADGSRVSGSDSNTTTLTTGSLSGSLSKITVDNGTDSSGRGASILRIRIGGSTLLNPVIGVNGFYLPMDGNSPIGHDLSKPNPVNNGTTWSSGTVNGTPYNATYTWEKAFDGNLTGTGAAGGVNTANQFNLALPNIDITGKNVTIYGNSNSADVWLNGTQLFMTSGTVYSGSVYQKSFTSSDIGSTTLTQIGLDAGLTVYGVAIDGVILIDGMYGNGWTPSRFGGSNSLEKATGAKPILNTDGGGSVARPGVFGSEENLFYTVTTANGSVYQFDITSGNNPSLSFIRGATYRFDYTSHSSHPLRFSSTNPDSSTSAYTDGTNTSVSNVITITVPHNAPDTLYYYCTAHASGMNGSISVITDETKADPYAWKNTLALPLVGNSSDVSNSVNSGSTTKTITNNGVNISNANSNFYGGSHYWDGGTTDRLTVTYNSEFQFGTGDFCVEFWVNLSTTSGNQYFWDFDTNGGNFQYNSNVLSYSDGYVAGGGPLYSTGIKLAVGKWYHLAFTRKSGIGRIFVDGTMRATGTTTYNYNQTSVLDIGNGYNNSGYEITGYMQDFRIYKGVAKYTTDFVVPATSPDILPDTPSGVSGGSKLAKVTDGAVSFDGSGDFLTVPGNTDIDVGAGDFTVECLVYKNTASEMQIFDFRGNPCSTGWALYTKADGRLEVYDSGAGTQLGNSNPYNLTVGTWDHISLTKSGSTVTFWVNGVNGGTFTRSSLASTTSLRIGISCDGNSPFNGFMSNVRILKGTALYTSNFTPPFRTLTNVTNTKLLCCQSNTSVHVAAVIPGTFSNDGTTWSSTVSGAVAGSPYDATKMFDGNLDTYTDHNAQNSTITWTRTLTSVTSLRVYIHQGNSTGTVTTVGGNGTQVDTISTNFGPGWHNITLGTTGSTINSIAFTRGGSGNPLSIHAVEVNGTALIDGFVGKPVLKAGDAAATTLNPFTTDIDAVRGQESGYSTWNPLSNYGLTLANGNLDWQGGTNQRYCRPTLFADSGKWYCEFHMRSTSHIPGIIREDHKDAAGILGELASSRFQNNGTIGYSGGDSVTGGTTWAAGDCVQLFMDMDNKSIYWGVNGIMKIGDDGLSGNPLSGSKHTGAVIYPGVDGLTDRISEKAWGPAAGTPSANSTSVYSSVNFGQKPFKYAPPEGYQPWNGANIRPETVIARSDHYVAATIYTGNGTGQSINTGQKPDFVWIKNRTDTTSHMLFDSVRGIQKVIYSNAVTQELPAAISVTAFNRNGFTVSSANEINGNNDNIVAWTWKAGGNKNTFNVDDVGYASATAAGLDGGTLNPTAASVGTKQGFSIIKYTGAGAAKTINHGLNQAPEFMLVKRTDANASWAVYHIGTGNTKVFELNSTTQPNTSSSVWNSTTPTSSVFSIGDYADSGGNSNVYISYLWHSVPGLQKFGTYDGNSSNDGPFIELGFRPAVLLIKRYDGAGNWIIVDSKRNPFNVVDKQLLPNLTDGDYTEAAIDLVSNGFKVRLGSSGHVNQHDFIYMAWAEAPAFNLYGAQSNAR